MTQLIIIVSSNVTLQWRRKQIASGGGGLDLSKSKILKSKEKKFFAWLWIPPNPFPPSDAYVLSVPQDQFFPVLPFSGIALDSQSTADRPEKTVWYSLLLVRHNMVPPCR